MSYCLFEPVFFDSHNWNDGFMHSCDLGQFASPLACVLIWGACADIGAGTLRRAGRVPGPTCEPSGHCGGAEIRSPG